MWAPCVLKKKRRREKKLIGVVCDVSLPFQERHLKRSGWYGLNVQNPGICPNFSEIDKCTLLQGDFVKNTFICMGEIQERCRHFPVRDVFCTFCWSCPFQPELAWVHWNLLFCFLQSCQRLGMSVLSLQGQKKKIMVWLTVKNRNF